MNNFDFRVGFEEEDDTDENSTIRYVEEENACSRSVVNAPLNNMADKLVSKFGNHPIFYNCTFNMH